MLTTFDAGTGAPQWGSGKGAKESPPASLKDCFESLVCVRRVAEPGKVPVRQGPAGVPRGVKPPSERELPGPADPLEARNYGARRRPVHRIDRQARQGGEVRVPQPRPAIPALPPLPAVVAMIPR